MQVAFIAIEAPSARWMRLLHRPVDRWSGPTLRAGGLSREFRPGCNPGM